MSESIFVCQKCGETFVQELIDSSCYDCRNYITQINLNKFIKDRYESLRRDAARKKNQSITQSEFASLLMNCWVNYFLENKDKKNKDPQRILA